MGRSLAATKHFHLTRLLRQELQAKQAGELLDTVANLKSRFGVSQATVTRALQRLQQEGLVYRPAGRNRLIIADVSHRPLHRVTLIRPTWPSPDYDAITRALITAGEQRGWAFDVITNRSDMEDLDLEQAVGDNDASVLLSSAVRLPESVLASLRRPRRPVVTALEVPDDPLISGVSADDHRVGELAVEHLASLGHRDILAVVNEPPSRSIFERTMGWRDAMGALGVRRRDLMLDCSVRPGQDSLDLTYKYLCRWLANEPPRFTAVFCVSWTGALATMRAMREIRGWRVPQDVSLVTYAGESLLVPYLDPPLTAIQTDVQAYATHIVEQLERLLDDPQSPPKHIRVQPTLELRQSTRRLAS